MEYRNQHKTLEKVWGWFTEHRYNVKSLVGAIEDLEEQHYEKTGRTEND